MESFHLSGHTFRFCWTVQDLEVFLDLVIFVFGSERINMWRESDVKGFALGLTLKQVKGHSEMAFYLADSLPSPVNRIYALWSRTYCWIFQLVLWNLCWGGRQVTASCSCRI